MTQRIWDTIVIGGGAAGLSAAQALGRSLRSVLVIDAGSPRNRFATHMHNVLGHDGRPPAELLEMGRAEAARYGVEFLQGSVRTVREAAGSGAPGGGEPLGAGARLAVELVGQGRGPAEVLLARAVVVASGASDVLPEIPGLAEHWGSSVLHCPYCHGWEERGRRIGVVTTSPLGMHQARIVRQWSDDVTLFSAGLGELDEATEREFMARGVKIVREAVTEVVGGGAVPDASAGAAGITAVRTADGAEHPIDIVFTSSAVRPHDAFLAELGLDRAEQPTGGDTVAVDAMHRTSHPRVWAVGNVVAPMAIVPVTAAAGAMAGLAINSVLVEEDYATAAASVRDGGGAA